MLKKIKVSAITMFFGILIQSCNPSGNNEAYINTPKLLAEYEGMKIARQELEKRVKMYEANTDTLGLELENSIKQFEKERGGMTQKERELSEQLLRSKQRQLQEYQQGVQQKIQEEDQKLTEQVLSKVNSYIKDYGKKNGYKFIYGATNTGNIVYADENLDLTKEILEGLNNEYRSNQ